MSFSVPTSPDARTLRRLRRERIRALAFISPSTPNRVSRPVAADFPSFAPLYSPNFTSQLGRLKLIRAPTSLFGTISVVTHQLPPYYGLPTFFWDEQYSIHTHPFAAPPQLRAQQPTSTDASHLAHVPLHVDFYSEFINKLLPQGPVFIHSNPWVPVWTANIPPATSTIPSDSSLYSMHTKPHTATSKPTYHRPYPPLPPLQHHGH